MTALVKVREYDSDTKTFHDWYMCIPECDNFGDVGTFIDEHFGNDAALVKVELVDTPLYVDAEVFEKLRNDDYFNESYGESVDYEDDF